MDTAIFDKVIAAASWLIPLFVLIGLILAYRLVLRIFGVVMIPGDSIGIVNKKYVIAGKNRGLPDGAVIALNGEAGLQADTLPPGVHFWLWPWQYVVTVQPFITVPEDKIGIVEARDGHPLSSGRVLARYVDCDAFQNARAFLTGHGERGPQITIIPPGTYRINTALFTVRAGEVREVPENMVGIVTTREGAALRSGEIAGKEIPGHNMFQDGQTFVTNGGFKGLQEQPILAGRYYLNPLFADVELVPMTTVPIAHVGVVIAYIGDEGKDVSGDDFKHGNLVSRGEKGVWSDPLDPGKYPINPYTHKVEEVPTANIVLNWANNKTESHKLDANLCSITVRSSDGFTFNLDVSQIIHVSRSDAAKVIARFGTILNLITQVLEPTIGNYFRNAAQGSDAIVFLKERTKRQAEAKDAIGKVLLQYNVMPVDTLIGDIVPPAALMETLTQRKIAEQQQVTFATQQAAEESRKNFAQAKATADTQPQVVTAERSVQIAEFNAQAAVKTAEGAAKAVTVSATAEATRLKAVGDAEAARTLAIGSAEAEVTKRKIESMESGNYAVVETAKALAAAGQPLVPDTMVSGNAEGGGLVALLLAQALKSANGHVKGSSQ